MQRIAHTTALAAATKAQTYSQTIDLDSYGCPDLVGIQVNYANATTAGKVFTVASQVSETLTMTGHGQVTGSKGQCTNSGGALPTGISALTDYFIIVVDANTVKLASSLALAVAGTAIDISGDGTGVQTFTPTTSAGNVIKARFSHDDTYYTDITTTNFPTCPIATVTVATTTGGVYWDLQKPAARYLNLLFTPSAGTITFSVLIDCKKDK
jgi:hypothetical protein